MDVDAQPCAICGKFTDFVLSCDSDIFICGPICRASKEEFLLQEYFNNHVWLTYIVVLDILQMHVSATLTANLDRLLLNQENIGLVMEGTADSPTTRLLKIHITEAGGILNAVRDDKDASELIDAWNFNGRQIADRWHRMRPVSLPQKVVRDLFQTHLNQTLAYSTSVKKGFMKQAVKEMDIARNHMMVVAAAIAGALQKSE